MRVMDFQRTFAFTHFIYNIRTPLKRFCANTITHNTTNKYIYVQCFFYNWKQNIFLARYTAHYPFLLMSRFSVFILLYCYIRLCPTDIDARRRVEEEKEVEVEEEEKDKEAERKKKIFGM